MDAYHLFSGFIVGEGTLPIWCAEILSSAQTSRLWHDLLQQSSASLGRRASYLTLILWIKLSSHMYDSSLQFLVRD